MIKLNLLNVREDEAFNESLYKKDFIKVLKTTSKRLKVKEKRVLNVVICDDDYIHKYNLKYREIDKETDVLSFPSDENGELGDVLINYNRATLQAKDYGHSLKRELCFLLIHGALHCLGYDHIKAEDEKIMFPLQEEILSLVNIKREENDGQ